MRSPVSLPPLLLLFAATLALGCASPPGGGELRFAGTAESGTFAQVEVDATPLAEERRTAFLAHGGAARLGTAVLRELAEAGKGAPGTFVKVQVTDFRLRSSSAAFWVGAMAGADTLACSVEVVKEGGVPRTFRTDTSTVLGGVVMPGSPTRFDRLVAELAHRIAEGV
jgi:hypothetical protein